MINKFVQTQIKKRTKRDWVTTVFDHLEFRYTCLKIQKYLQTNRTEIKREKSQLIFRLRCRVTEAKVNLKGKQAGAELCQAQFKQELGGFYLASYFALIGVGC